MGPYDQFFQQRQAQQMQRPMQANQMQRPMGPQGAPTMGMQPGMPGQGMPPQASPQALAALQAMRQRAAMPMGPQRQPPQGMDAYASLLQQGQRQPMFPGARPMGAGGMAGQPPTGMPNRGPQR